MNANSSLEELYCKCSQPTRVKPKEIQSKIVWWFKVKNWHYLYKLKYSVNYKTIGVQKLFW